MQAPIPDADFLSRDKFLNTLAESYVLHESILNSTELSVISTTRDGIINSINKATERVLGYEGEELVGKVSVLVAFDPEELAARAKMISQDLGKEIKPGLDSLVGPVVALKRSNRSEWSYVRKDHSRLTVSVSVSGVWSESGDINGFIIIASDITEQKRADEELRRSQKHLNALVESLDDIAAEVSEEGRYLNIWTSREDLLFDQREKYIGRTLSDMLTEPLADRYQELVNKVIMTGRPEVMEYQSIKPGVDQWYLAKISRFSEKSVLILIREVTDQKRAEIALVESEQRFRLLTENVPGVIYLCHNDATYSNVFISANIETLSGYAPSDFLNGAIDIQHLIHPDDLDFAEGRFKEALAQHGSYHLEYRLVHKSGEIRWVRESGGGLYSHQGLDLIEGYLSDITDQKKAELALKESETKFRLLAENIPGAIYLCHFDERFSVIYVNENVDQVTGYTAEQFRNGEVSFADIIHPEDRPRVFTQISEAVALKKSYHLQFRILHKDGKWRWMEEFGAGVAGSDGPQLLEGVICDITDQKRAEADLEKMSQENLRIFNSSPGLQAVSGFDGFYKNLNPVWERTFGWRVEEMKERPLMDFVHPDDVASSRAAFDLLIEGTPVSFENRFRCKDGSYRWLLWSASTDDESQLVHTTGVDITERKKAEEQLLLSKTNLEVAAQELQEQNRQLNEFAHIISHNLRSPVGNIQALISLLSKDSSVKEYQEVFTNLQRTSVNLRETLNELLDILRVKKEKSLERTTLLFSEILKKAKQNLMGEIINSNAKIRSDFSACPHIQYYKAYLESIILNLLSNALKYRFPGRPPEIFFETLIRTGRPLLKVRDNGLGIDLERVGDQLFGLRKVFHENKEARGVGLFLTKTQVEAMGGKIWAESKVDSGSCFYIEF